jgi:hypothetical protein
MKSIKLQHLLFCSLFGTIAQISFGQGVAEKKLQGGLTGSVGFNYLKMGTDLLEGNPGMSTSIGVNFIKSTKESQNISLTAGLEFDFDRINYRVTDKDVFYYFIDKEIISKDNYVSSAEIFNLTERTYQPLYLALPLGFLFRTDFIGDFRGMFSFNVRNRVLLRNTINDQGFVVPSVGSVNGSTKENIGMISSKDLLFYNANLGISAGVEWNFSGSTCLLVELGYHYGFTPLHLKNKEKNYSLFTNEPNGNTFFANQANMNQANLKFTLLF